MMEHRSALCLPPITGDETIFEYLVDDKGKCIIKTVGRAKIARIYRQHKVDKT